MKLLPEVPTQEIAVAVKKIEDAYGIPIPLTEVYSAIFTAAPDVKDEHCGWCHFVEYAEYVTALEICDSDAIGAFKVYRHPSQRIAALEAEVKRLHESMWKVIAHTPHNECAPNELLVGLLANINRIANAAIAAEGK